MDFDREKIIAAFVAESEEGLERTEQYLIAAETDPGNTGLPCGKNNYFGNIGTTAD